MQAMTPEQARVIGAEVNAAVIDGSAVWDFIGWSRKEPIRVYRAGACARQIAEKRGERGTL
jgi:hypothetical protein